MVQTIGSTLPKEKLLLVLLFLAGLVGGVCAFNPAYFSNHNVLIGLALFPFSFLITGPTRINSVFVLIASAFLLVATKYNLNIAYFFALSFYFLWLIELFFGRLNVLVLFLTFFMSPFFIQVVTILGFPLRLLLSAFAGEILNIARVEVQVEGNTILLNGSLFSVDEACMGLNMLAISMLMGVFVLAFRYRTSRKWLEFLPTAFFFLAAFALNMVTNVIRIVTLVYLKIPADDPGHQLVGILCLVMYVLVPLHFFSAWLVNRHGKTKDEVASSFPFTRKKAVFSIAFAVAVVITGLKVDPARRVSQESHAPIQFGDLPSEKMEDGITKISTEDVLIYVKSIPEFFTGEHTPLMCWEGSGYDISAVKTTTVAGREVYKGILLKDGKSLHTAWWYSNGPTSTISQLDWRMRMLKGEPDFFLVNVTTEDESTLLQSVNALFTTRPLTVKL